MAQKKEGFPSHIEYSEYKSIFFTYVNVTEHKMNFKVIQKSFPFNHAKVH